MYTNSQFESNDYPSCRSFVAHYHSQRSDCNGNGHSASDSLQPLLLPKAISQNGLGSPRTMAALKKSDAKSPKNRILAADGRISFDANDMACDDDSPGETLPQLLESLVGSAPSPKKRTSDAGTAHLYESVWDDALRQEQEYLGIAKDAKKPLAFVEEPRFQTIASTVIAINSLAIGISTDIQSKWWFWLEIFVLMFFVFELSAKIYRHGMVGFLFTENDDRLWNVLDFSLVAVGVFDEWLVPLACLVIGNGKKDSETSTFVNAVRMLRLLRIVRLIRLVKMVRPLFEMAQGIIEALQGIFWVLVFILMFVYAISILCTRLIGQGVLSTDDSEELVEIRAMFGSVGESMFILFQLMSCWGLVKFERLFDAVPFSRACFVLFYVLAAWALLAVMTGVVSFNMISMKTKMNEEDEKREMLRKIYALDLMMELFIEADTDNSGEVSRQEFYSMLQSKVLMKKIMKNTNVKVQDLDDLFDWIDHDRSGTVTIQEFMEGFKWLNEPLSQKMLLKIERKIQAHMRRVWNSVDSKLDLSFGHVIRTIQPSLRKISAVAQQVHILEATFCSVRDHLQYTKERHEQSLVLKKAIDQVEDKAMRHLNEVIARLERLEVKMLKDNG